MICWCVKFGKQTFFTHIGAMVAAGLISRYVWICCDYSFGCEGQFLKFRKGCPFATRYFSNVLHKIKASCNHEMARNFSIFFQWFITIIMQILLQHQ